MQGRLRPSFDSSTDFRTGGAKQETSFPKVRKHHMIYDWQCCFVPCLNSPPDWLHLHRVIHFMDRMQVDVELRDIKQRRAMQVRSLPCNWAQMTIPSVLTQERIDCHRSKKVSASHKLLST